MKRFYFLFVLIVFVSCSQSESIKELNVEINLKNIRTHDQLEVFYKNYQVIGDTLILFDRFNHQLTLIDLKDDIIQTIPIELNGPNGFDTPIGFYFNKTGDFALADDFSIAFFQNGAKKTKSMDLMDDSFFLNRSSLYGNPGYSGYRNHILYDTFEDRFFVYFQKKPNEIRKSLIGSLSFNDLTIKTIPIDYPSEYDEVEFTGRLFQLSTCQSDEGAYFVFSGSPEIIYYDFATQLTTSKTVESFEGKLSGDPPLSYEADQNQMNQYLVENPFYTAVHFDHNSKLLYRISSPPLGSSDFSNPDFFQDRQLILSVMDKEMNLLGQINLPKKRYDSNFLFAYSEGIWISLKRSLQDDEKMIKGDLFQIKGFHY